VLVREDTLVKHYLTKIIAMLITAAMVCNFGLLKIVVLLPDFSVTQSYTP
jgi:hypothetical protein